MAVRNERYAKWCLQQFTEKDMIEYNCKYKDCRTCGHNMVVADFRKRQINRNGLTKCSDGLYRYILPYTGRKNGSKNS